MNPLGGRGAFESGYFINGQGYFHQDIPDTPRPNLMIMNPPTRTLYPVVPTFNVIPYDRYFHEIVCLTTGTTSDFQNAIRNYIHTVCFRENAKVYTGTLKLPREDIPQGTWTVGFAPSILHNGGWVIIFAIPQDSQTVWYFWPEKNGRSEASMLEFFGHMKERGRIRMTEPMGVGDQRHKLFHAMVEQAVWAQQNLQEVDLGTGEFRHRRAVG